MTIPRLGLLIAAIVVLAGCASGGMTAAEREAAISDMISGAESAHADREIPPLPSAARALLTPPPLELEQRRPVREPRFDITADRVEVAAFYHGLVEDTPYNVIVHPEVTGTVSLRLSDVSVPEVMNILREGHGYHYKRVDGSYLILPTRLETRVFRLDYINVQREGISGTRVTAGDISGGEDQGGGGELSGSSLTTRSESQLWADIELAIEKIIGDDNEAARVVTSPEASAVVVRATPDELTEIESFMTGLQDTLNRQVILEARIVEVSLSDRFSAGIDWDLVGTASGRDTEVDLTALTSEDITGGFELFIERAGSFSATIDALQEQGDVMVLSSPRVSTLNNQKALIKVGTDSFFQTGVDLDTEVTDQGTITRVDPEFSSFFSGISLDVTPNIDVDGFVTLHIQPSVSSVTEIPRTVDVSDGETVSFRLASSDVRQSDSIVRAGDGELIVIGGLMEERERTTDGRVPVLGEIPPLSPLFTRQRRSSEKVELVILLRPTVVRDETWRDAIDDQLEQML